MRFLGKTTFVISTLNQEKIITQLSKKYNLYEINRKDKKTTKLSCDFYKSKSIEKELLSLGVDIEEKRHSGICFWLLKAAKNYAFIAAIFASLIFLFFSNQYILRYEITGTEIISQNEVVQFLKNNETNKKFQIEEKKIEKDLIENFEQISLVSCVIKGQTLIVNIKEKLHPNSIFGDFLPIIADENCKIIDIKLVSGTANIKVGDYVMKGQVLIEPFFVDENGNMKKVEAKASIIAQVYNEGSVCHYDEYIETYRTGKTIVTNQLKLFGLPIYSNGKKIDFEKYEVEIGNVDLSKNMIMPFKLYKNVYYELKERLVKSNFEEVEQQYVEKARKKAFENCNDCDKIIEEYYTTKSMAGVTVVSYCVITEKNIGVYNDC